MNTISKTMKVKNPHMCTLMTKSIHLDTNITNQKNVLKENELIAVDSIHKQLNPNATEWKPPLEPNSELPQEEKNEGKVNSLPFHSLSVSVRASNLQAALVGVMNERKWKVKAAVRIQKFYRVQLARRVLKTKILKTKLAIFCQRWYRGNVVRKISLGKRKQKLQQEWQNKRKEDLKKHDLENLAIATNFVEARLQYLRVQGCGEVADKIDAAELSKLFKEIEFNLVGLEPVKKFIYRFFIQFLRFTLKGDILKPRVFMITGSLGTGKRKSSELLARFFCAIQMIDNNELYKRHAKNFDDNIANGCLNYVMLDKDEKFSKRERNDFDAAMRYKIKKKTIVVIESRDRGKAHMFASASDTLRKREPIYIHLDNYTSRELAQIVSQELETVGCFSSEITLETIERAITAKWTPMELASRGIYIAKDAVEYIKDSQVTETCKLRGLKSHVVPSQTKSSMKKLSSDKLACGRRMFQKSHILEAFDLDAADMEKNEKNKKSSKNSTAKQDSERESQRRLKRAKARAEVDKEIENLVGMANVKAIFEEFRGKVAYVEKGGKQEIMNINMNMVFTGNPGTGKTTLARLMHKFLFAYNILKKDVFIEKSALELKAEYCGQTTPLVQATINSGMGGTVFLDEAYSLNKGDSFSREAIATLLTSLENNRTSVLCILAGYRDKMSAMMRDNSGFERRFQTSIHLPDYSPADLVEIAVRYARRKFDMEVEPDVIPLLEEAIKSRNKMQIKEKNGGLAIEYVEKAMSRFANRMARLARHSESLEFEDQSILTASDFDVTDLFSGKAAAEAKKKLDKEKTIAEEKKNAEDEVELEKWRKRNKIKMDALLELQSMVGFEIPKKYVDDLTSKINLVEKGLLSKKVLNTCMHLILTGSPGTGKTTLARLLHKILYGVGILRKNVFIERNATQLKGQYVGQTTPKVLDAFASAEGGTLFLDEAYALSATNPCGKRDSFANDALATLLTEAENRRTDVFVVLAGYADKMQVLLDADPGLRRRFPTFLNLPNYTAPELAKMASIAAIERFDIKLVDGCEKKLCKYIRKSTNDMKRYNASLPIILVERAITNMAVRVQKSLGNIEEERKTKVELKLKYEDFMESNSENSYHP